MALVALTMTATACADEVDIPPEHHAWARFPKGSWKRVRVVTQQLNEQAQVVSTSITDTKTLLADVQADRFSLQIESTIEVAGRKIVSDPRTVEQRYNGAIAGQIAKVRLLGEETLTIGQRSYACKVLQYEITGTQTKTVTKSYYTPETAPYVLRRDSKTVDLMTKATVARTLVEVTAVGVPVEILGKTHLAAKVHVEQKHPKGREVTDALSSLDIPGGIVSHESREYDASDRLLSSSKLELVEFHIAPAVEDSQSRLLPNVWQQANMRFLLTRYDCRHARHTEARGRSHRRGSSCAR
jgi:hypothetical protein